MVVLVHEVSSLEASYCDFYHFSLLMWWTQTICLGYVPWSRALGVSLQLAGGHVEVMSLLEVHLEVMSLLKAT